MVGEGATEDFMLKRGDLQTCRTPCQVPLHHSATKKHLFLQDKKSCLKNSKPDEINVELSMKVFFAPRAVRHKAQSHIHKKLQQDRVMEPSVITTAGWKRQKTTEENNTASGKSSVQQVVGIISQATIVTTAKT